MFAGAIVMQRRWRLPSSVDRRRGRLMDRRMRATSQSRGVKTCTRENALRCRHVVRLAAVGGASERKLSPGQAVTLSRSGFHEYEGLQRLDGGAWKYRPFDVAKREHNATIRIGHSDRATMPGLDYGTAQDFDKNRIAHGRGD